jgi:hypothetical protein
VALALGLILDVPHVWDDEDLPGPGVLPHLVVEPDHRLSVQTALTDDHTNEDGIRCQPVDYRKVRYVVVSIARIKDEGFIKRRRQHTGDNL